MKLDEAISNRASIRKFSNKKVRWDSLLEAIDASIKAPFAGNINNIQFIIVENQETKNTMAEYSQQHWIAQAPYVVVVCSHLRHLLSMYEDKARDYSKQQVGAAIENFLLKITDMGLASCWVGSFIEEPIRKEIKLPDEWEIEALLPVGYSHSGIKPVQNKKESLERALHWEKWNVRKKPTPFKDPSTKE